MPPPTHRPKGQGKPGEQNQFGEPILHTKHTDVSWFARTRGNEFVEEVAAVF